MFKLLSRAIILTFLILSCSGFMAHHSNASGNLEWEKNPDTLTVHLNAVSFGNDSYVAVGEDGMIKTSEDGYYWDCRNSGVNTVLTDIIWGNNRFVAVGFSGTIISSTDGITWTSQNSGTENPLIEVIWDGTKYIAVGGKGTILTSFDGIRWKQTTPFTTDTLFGIAHKEGMYIIVGENKLIRSSNGTNWTQAEFKKEYNFVAIDRNSNLFVATGLRYEGSERRVCILTSPDGVKWSSYEQPADGDLTGITYNGTRFVLVGTDMTAILEDGLSWSVRKDTNILLNDVVFAGGLYVGVGTDGLIEVSEDAIYWTSIRAINQCDFKSIIWANNTFIGLGGNGNATLLHSDSGQEWTSIAVESQLLRDGVWNGARYVAVGDGGYILTSSNGETWQSSILTGNPNLKSILWNGEQFVIVGDGGKIYTSADGAQWTAQSSGTTDSLNGIAWNGEIFAAAGGTSSEKIILTSTDGITWTKSLWIKENNKEFRGIVWANNRFLAFGSGGFLISSRNGTTWSAAHSDTTWGINDIAWDGTEFHYVGDFGIMGTSKDGINWKSESSGTTLTLKSIVWNGEQLAAAGDSSVVLTGSPRNIIKVEIDHTPLVFDVAPITQNSRTLVPLRGIFEALGAEVTWDDKTKTATAEKGSMTMTLTVGSSTASINGLKTQLETPAINYNGRILVPTRFIAESFGASVDWDPQTRTVIIGTN